jgi:hypothetical protein
MCGPRFEKLCGPADIFFGYRTPAVINIRDKRLGISFLIVEILILLYVILYSVILLQSHRERGVISGVSKLSLRSPQDVNLRRPPELQYYCLGSNETTLQALSPSSPWYQVPRIW